jgi:hypothetical protein
VGIPVCYGQVTGRIPLERMIYPTSSPLQRINTSLFWKPEIKTMKSSMICLTFLFQSLHMRNSIPFRKNLTLWLLQQSMTNGILLGEIRYSVKKVYNLIGDTHYAPQPILDIEN